MNISKIQEEVLNKTPLFLCQDEVNLNRVVWVDNLGTKDFRRSTIDALLKKDLLILNEIDIVVLSEKSMKLGYKST